MVKSLVMLKEEYLMPRRGENIHRRRMDDRKVVILESMTVMEMLIIHLFKAEEKRALI